MFLKINIIQFTTNIVETINFEESVLSGVPFLILKLLIVQVNKVFAQVPRNHYLKECVKEYEILNQIDF